MLAATLNGAAAAVAVLLNPLALDGRAAVLLWPQAVAAAAVLCPRATWSLLAALGGRAAHTLTAAAVLLEPLAELGRQARLLRAWQAAEAEAVAATLGRQASAAPVAPQAVAAVQVELGTRQEEQAAQVAVESAECGRYEICSHQSYNPTRRERHRGRF
tara:strand:- start:177 stop:653 length:477 start_codon:yes stop_codon:yes gene_type:complete